MRNILVGVLRIMMGWVFLWAFIDKLLGLGFATEYGKGWIDGGSPTYGFLMFATKGPFAEFFKSLAGNPFIDFAFMFGLFGIGTALILGVATRFACWSGFVLLMLMFFAGFIPPEHNPLIDDHVIYAFILLVLANLRAGDYLGLGNWWSHTKLVKTLSFLK